jgi:hypothetical protein
MNIKIYILALLALAMSSFLLIHFGLIMVFGKFYIYESNTLVLVLEITMTVSILSFGLYCLIDEIRKGRRIINK